MGREVQECVRGKRMLWLRELVAGHVTWPCGKSKSRKRVLRGKPEVRENGSGKPGLNTPRVQPC